jgi:hypothetical protein
LSSSVKGVMRARERGTGDEALLGSVEGEGEDEDEGEVGTRWGQGGDKDKTRDGKTRTIARTVSFLVVVVVMLS